MPNFALSHLGFPWRADLQGVKDEGLGERRACSDRTVSQDTGFCTSGKIPLALFLMENILKLT